MLPITALRRRRCQSIVKEKQQREGAKALRPSGWPAKGTLTSLKMLDVALATPCAFRLIIAPFAGHSRLWGFLRWVLLLCLRQNTPPGPSPVGYADAKSASASGPRRLAPLIEKAPYLAYCIARVSRMTFTLISPGYCTAFSISSAISLDSRTASSSLTRSALTMTRTSRPALMA